MHNAGINKHMRTVYNAYTVLIITHIFSPTANEQNVHLKVIKHD